MAFTGNASTIASHAALRLLSHAIDQTAFVMSANAAPDGGGGTYVYVATDTSSGCMFTGSVTGTTLSVTSVTNGALAIGFSVNRSDTGAGIGKIVPGGTGTGGVGTYNLSASASITGPFAFTADNDSSFIVAVDGGRWFNVGYFQQTAAELATGLTPTNYSYPPCNVLRYGVVPNSSSAASANASILQTLFSASSSNGPTGFFYFPNTTGADIYIIGAVGASCVITVRDGCTIDLNGCTLNMAATGNATDANSGFWFAIRDFTLQNGTINTNFVAATGATSAGNCVQIGARKNSALRWPISILDASLSVPMGNITLRNLRLNPSGSGVNLGGIAALAVTGGVTNMIMENVVMTGTGNGGVQFGVSYEFGFATAPVVGDSGSSTAQSSHMSGFRMNNCSVQNFDNVLASSTAVTLTGAFDVIIENFAFGGISNGITVSTGECLNFRPWVGTQAQLGNDTGAKRNVKLVNIVGGNFNGAALSLAGATSRAANSGYRQLGWVPGHSYVNGGGGSGTNLGMTVVNPTLGSLVAGSLYTTGTYSNVALTGGSSSGMKAKITVASGAVTAVALTATGGSYKVGDVLSAAAADIGMTGSGFTITVTAVNAYICTASGTSATTTGPTGTGIGITDNTVTWDYLPLTVNTDLYDFSIDGLALNCGATGGAIATTAGHFDLRNTTISAPAGNNESGIILGDECTFFNLENVKIFGMGVEACRFDFGNFASNTWSPSRPKKGTFKNCYFAGNGTSAAAGTFPAISIANCDGVTVDACRFGYETAYSGRSETSQGTGVNLNSATTVQNVFVKNCRFGGVAGGSRYAVQSNAGGTNNANCRFENNTVGSGILNTAGAWLSDSVLTQTLVNGSIITNNGASGSYRTVHCAAASGVTGIKLQPGVNGGQLLALINTAAGGGSITFDVVGNSNVAEGASNPIATLTGRTFIWDSTAGLWYRSA